MDLIAQLARELNLKAANVEAAVKLIDEGNTCLLYTSRYSQPDRQTHRLPREDLDNKSCCWCQRRTNPVPVSYTHLDVYKRQR